VFRPASRETLAAFAQPASAVRAALALAASKRPAELGFGLRVAVHAGRCLAMTRAGGVEYFGETLERTVALLAVSRPGHVAVSHAVEEDTAALAVMHDPEVARLAAVTQTGPYGGRRVIQLVVNENPAASG
jgi:class 3 adenylate cyclase